MKEGEVTNLNISLMERQKMQRDIQQDLNNTMSGKETELNGIRHKMIKW